jgi:cytochrome c
MRQPGLKLCLIASVAVCAAIAAVKPKESAGDVDKGKGVFTQQCVMCHNPADNEKKMGPGLKGLFKKEKMANGKKATEQNVREQIDEGGNGMPPYKEMLSAEEHTDLIAYLKTL